MLLPKKRPQDDVPVGFDRPQEEEFGMMMLGEGTPYLTHAWPRLGPADTDYLDFKGVPEPEKKKWADAYMWFYRRLALKHDGKRLVMKTPANAARLKLLTKLFPDARYVYLARNPLNVFPSTVKLWRALYSVQGLHNPPQSRSLARRLRARHVRAADRGLRGGQASDPEGSAGRAALRGFRQGPGRLDARHLPAPRHSGLRPGRGADARLSRASAPSTKSRATTCRRRSSGRWSSGSSPISTASATAMRSTRR